MLTTQDIYNLYENLSLKNNISQYNLIRLFRHVILVRNISEKIVDNINKNTSLSKFKLNKHLVLNGALLHDIGRFYCQPIVSNGYPILFHGLIGGYFLKLLGEYKSEDMTHYAKICERHMGAGVEKKEFFDYLKSKENNLKIEVIKFLKEQIDSIDFFKPQSIEEIIVCFSDKLVSKNKIISINDAYFEIENRFGKENANKFKTLFLILKNRGAFVNL
jgi:hypothetical protein